MRVLRYFLVFLFFGVCAFSFGQDREVDSLKRELTNVKNNDSLEFEIKYRLASLLRRTDPQSAEKYLKEFTNLDISTKRQSDAFILMGTIQENYGSFDKAMSLYKKGLGIAKKSNYNEGIARSYLNMGSAYFHHADYKKASDSYLEAMKYQELDKNYTEIAKTKYNLGLLYEKIGEYEKAIKMAKESLVVFSDNDADSVVLSIVNNGIGHNYVLLYEDDSAELYYRKAINLGDTKGYALHNLGNLLVYKKQYGEADRLMKLALSKRIALRDTLGMLMSYTALGQSAIEQGKYKTADSLIRLNIDISTKIDNKERLMISYLNKFKLDSTRQNYTSAIESLKDFYETRNMILAPEIADSLKQELDIKYETDKKEQENKILALENEQQAKENRYLLTGGIVLLIIVLAISFLTYKLNTAKIKNEQLAKEIGLKNKELESVNNELEGTNDRLKTSNDDLEESQRLLEVKNKVITEAKEKAENLESILSHDVVNDLDIFRDIKDTNFEDIASNPNKLRELEDIQAVLSGLMGYYSIITSLGKAKGEQPTTKDVFAAIAMNIRAKYKRRDVNIDAIYSSMKVDFKNQNARNELRTLVKLVAELFRNSFKYAFPNHIENPFVSLEVLQKDNNVLHISYKDNGIGFQKKIEIKESSHGLGLFYKLAKQTGGDITYGNNPEGGAYINILFNDEIYKKSQKNY